MRQDDHHREHAREKLLGALIIPLGLTVVLVVFYVAFIATN